MGGRYSDDWHRVHLNNPRDVVPESNMPGFPWLSENLIDADDLASKMRALRTLGTPYTDEDIAGAAAAEVYGLNLLVPEIEDRPDNTTRFLVIGRKAQRGGGPTVTVSVSTHVPKPHTPFQWCAMDTLDEIRRKQHMLKDTARRLRVDLKVHESRGSTLEGALARGDSPLGRRADQ